MTTSPNLRPDTRLGNGEWADNWTLGAGLRMEVIDSNGHVWLANSPVTKTQARDLSLPAGTKPALLGGVIADVAYFNRSPGAVVDGPLESCEIDGLRFTFVARPAGQRRVEGATIMWVDKYHTLLYAAGRTIEVLDFGDGTFALPAWSGPDGARSEPAMPGWVRRQVELTDDLIAVIPSPATVVIFDDRFGFHGPLPISQLESACQ